MPIPSALLNDPTKRVRYTFDIATPTPRRWTNYIKGLTIDSLTFSYLDVSFDGEYVETAEDQTSVIACALRIGNVTNLATPLVNDSANTAAPITIKQRWFDATWAVTHSELFFEGILCRPSFDAFHVVIECRAYLGRRGASPSKERGYAWTSHNPLPQGHKIPWFTVFR